MDKKHKTSNHRSYLLTQKIPGRMKLTALSLALSLSAFASNVDAQQVSVSFTNAKVKTVLNTISDQTGLDLAYSSEIVDLNRKVSLNVVNSDVDKVLDTLFENTSTAYEIKDGKIYLFRTASNHNASITQQSILVQGVVYDETGAPVIGANVVVKGTTHGIVTDMDGKFSLEVAKGSTLVVSYIGYTDYIVKVNSQKPLSITLKEDSQSLNEVVVVGYGTQKKASLTGAVAAVSGEELTKRPVVNTATMLQGQIPGLRVNQATGQPGNEATSFRIRGQGTFSGAGSDPLVLINGVEGNIANLDPSVIESVSVLKDAASASIYGARAANGVILVTTKQGAGYGDNKAHISYNGNIGLYTPIKMYDVVDNSVEYMELFNMAQKNSGMNGLYSDEMIEAYRNGNDPVKYPNFNWLDYMFRTVAVQNHNLSVAGNAGKDRKTTYNLSLNYVDQPGTMRGFDYQKYNLTVDLTSEINDFIKIGSYSSILYGDRGQIPGGQGDAMLATLSQAPTYMPWLPDDGSGVRKWTNTAYGHEKRNKNIVAGLNSWHQTNRDFDINAQLWLDVKLFKGLHWYTKGAGRLQSNKMKSWNKILTIHNYHTGEANGTIGNPGLDVEDSRRLYTSLYTYLNYDVSTANKYHDFNLMVGYSQETEKFENLRGFRKHFAFDLPVLNAGATTDWSNSGIEQEWALRSFFGRFKYAYKDKYLFEANMRYDGTSRISPEHRWGIFPSFSAAWRLTEENFIKNLHWDWLKNFKLRGSWGKLGNQNIGLYPYQSMINHVQDYTFDNNNISTGYGQTAYSNRNIKWETTTITDVGADITLFDGLNITFDWYNKLTTDILRGSQVSGLLGLGAPTINNGEVQNRGIELSVNYGKRVSSGIFENLYYNVGGYLDRSRNKLVTFGAEEIAGYHIRREGLPYHQYYMLECTGVFADQAEVASSPKQFNDNTQPGDLKYKDQNGDGVINNDDRIPMGGNFPDFEYGFTASAEWKGFDISLLTQGVAGKYYYTTNWGVTPFMQGSAPMRDYVDGMWTEDHPNNAKHPKLYFNDMGGTKNQRANSYYLRNASYFRLKNLTVGYTLPKSFTDKLNMSRVRVFFSGDNLLTITNYTGLDPERGGDGTEVQYPQNKIYSFGLNVEF